jgi:branched-chain amino acid transport system substrate-binding protein
MSLTIRARRAQTTLVICVAAALALSACSSSTSSSGNGGSGGGGTYNVAELMDLTGAFAVPGGSTDAGMQAYVKKVNAAGGVNGKQVKVTVTDTASTDAANVAGMQKALASKPLAIMQGGNSSFPALLPLIKQSNIPFFTAGATDTVLYPSPEKNVFMTQASATQQANALVAEAKVVLGGSLSGKKIAFYGLSAAYIDGLLKVLNTKLSSEGASLVATERFPLTIVSFTPQASKIASSGADAVIFTGTSAKSAAGMKSLVDAGIKVPILGYSSSSSDATLKGTNASNPTGLRTTAVPVSGEPIKAAAEAVGFGGKAVDGNFSLGWETAAVVVEGLRRCGNSCTADKLHTALEQIANFEVPDGAVYGPISISASKHAVMTKAQFFKFDGSGIVKNGDPVSMD